MTSLIPTRLVNDLQESAVRIHAFKTGELILPRPLTPAQREIAQLRARVAELEAAEAERIKRIHREDRLNKVTRHVRDNRPPAHPVRRPDVILTNGDCYVRITPSTGEEA